MEPVSPKLSKAENGNIFQEQLKVGVGDNEQSDNAKFEMLIDELERLLGSGKYSPSSTLDGAQIQTEGTDPLEGVRPISNSDDDDVKVLEWPYHSSDSGKEFIIFEPAMPSKVDQLNFSARLVHADLEIWLHNVGRLMLVDKGFIAEVALINVNELSRAAGFGQAKSILLSQLHIVRIVLDDALVDRDNQRATLLNLFNQIRMQIATCRTSVGDAAQILRIAESSNKLDYCELCVQLRDNPAVSGGLKEQAVKLLGIEREIQRRNEVLVRFAAKFPDDAQELNTALLQVCEAVVSTKVIALLDKAPQFLCDLLKDIPLRTVYRVHADDVNVFHELEKVLNGEIFHKPLKNLAKRWIDRVQSSESCVSVLNPIYVSLFRSLEELIATIIASSDHDPEELLRSDQRGWHRLETAIKWRSETELAGCLEREYKLLFRLMNHFDPGAGTVGPFEYQAERPFDGPIADELRAWFCLLDDVLRDLDLGVFDQIVTSFVHLLQKSDGDQVEKIRILSHSAGRFILQTCPLANSVQSDEDKQILQLQLNVINRAMLGCVNTFRDLLEVVSCYWQNRCETVENSPRKDSVLTIVTLALQTNLEVPNVIALLRAVNALFDDPDGVSLDCLQLTTASSPAIPLGFSKKSSPEVASSSGMKRRRTVACQPAIGEQVNEDKNTEPKAPALKVPKSSNADPFSKKSSRCVCAWCNNSFQCQSHLNQHVRKHTGERPFICDLCQKGFSDKGNLAKHMRVHTGEKPYPCRVCGKAYKHNVSLKQHAKTHGVEQ